jgi:alpha-N-acetylglucosaminidase
MPDTSFVSLRQSFQKVIYSSGTYTGCLLFCFILLISCRTGREIREYNANVMPAYNALERLIGPRANEFVLRLTNHATDQVTISTARGEVIIEGSSIPAICYGAYTYLRKIGAVHISWEGNRVSLPAQWPDQSLQTLQSPFVYRQYLNVCAFGYTTVWWDWERW